MPATNRPAGRPREESGKKVGALGNPVKDIPELAFQERSAHAPSSDR